MKLKSLILASLLLSSMSAFAKMDYDCNMYPDEQGGYNFLVQLQGNKAKLYTITYSEQNRTPSYYKTLQEISPQNALIRHFAEGRNTDGYEIYLRRGAASFGRVEPRSGKFRIYPCLPARF